MAGLALSSLANFGAHAAHAHVSQLQCRSNPPGRRHRWRRTWVAGNMLGVSSFRSGLSSCTRCCLGGLSCSPSGLSFSLACLVLSSYTPALLVGSTAPWAGLDSSPAAPLLANWTSPLSLPRPLQLHSCSLGGLSCSLGWAPPLFLHSSSLACLVLSGWTPALLIGGLSCSLGRTPPVRPHSCSPNV